MDFWSKFFYNDVEICDYLCYNLDEVKRKRGSSVRLKNILIVVNDIELSKEFYQELFGLRVVTDFGENVILSEGLVLQEKKIWEQVTGKSVTAGGNNVELYFEEYESPLSHELFKRDEIRRKNSYLIYYDS